jgi:hypothetical protein
MLSANRLRSCNCDWETGECQGPLGCKEIERLRADNAKLRVALQKIADHDYEDSDRLGDNPEMIWQAVARRALEDVQRRVP